MAFPDNHANSFCNNTPSFDIDAVTALKRLEKNNGNFQGHSVRQISEWMRENCNYNKEDIEPRIRNTLRKMCEKYVIIRKEEKRILWKMSGYCNCTKCNTKKKMQQTPPLLCDNPSSSPSQGKSRPNYPITTKCLSRPLSPKSREIYQDNVRRSSDVAAYPNRNGNSRGDGPTSRIGSNSLHQRSSEPSSRTNIQVSVSKSNSTNDSTGSNDANIYKPSCNKGETLRNSVDGCHHHEISLIQKRQRSWSSHHNDSTDSDDDSSSSKPKRPHIQDNHQSSTHVLRTNNCKREDLQVYYLMSTSAEGTGTSSRLDVSASEDVQKATTARPGSNNCENNHVDVEKNKKDNDDDDSKKTDYEKSTYGTDSNSTSRCSSNIDDDTNDEYQVPEINNDDDIDGDGYVGRGNLARRDDVYNDNSNNDKDGEDNDANLIMCCIL